MRRTVLPIRNPVGVNRLKLYKTTKPVFVFCGKSTKKQAPVFFCPETIDKSVSSGYNGHRTSSNERIKKAEENTKKPEDDITWMYGGREGEVFMEKLDAKREAVLRRSSRKKSIRAVVYSLLWWGGLFALWFAYMHFFQRPFTDPGAFIFALLMVLPFVPYKLHRYLFGYTGYAVITKEIVAVDVPLKWYDLPSKRRVKNNLADSNVADVMTLQLQPERGESFKLTLIHPNITGDSGGPYFEKGDTVFMAGGFNFPVKLPMDLTNGIVCPSCGQMTGAGKHWCKWCRTVLAEAEKTE